MRRRSSSLTAFSFACSRVRIVRRKTVKPPFRVVAQLCVKPRKLKLSGLLVARSPVRRRLAAEFEQPRFVRVQRQTEPRKPLAQAGEKLLSVVSMFEPDDEVIGKPNDDHVAVRLPLAPSLSPEVEDVVQVDVRQ